MSRSTLCIALICIGLIQPASLAAQDNNSGAEAKPKTISFVTSDGGLIFADLYGKGDHAVVLAHGAIFNKESWAEQAKHFEKNGLQVLAIDFRGYGKSKAGTQKRALQLDILAAVRYLHAHGAKRVSVVGASMGGGAAARAAVESKQGEIDRLVLLAGVPIQQPGKLKGKILFVVSQGDRLKAAVSKQHQSAPKPKRLVVLEGKAHAQHIFKSEQSSELIDLITQWLTSESPTTD